MEDSTFVQEAVVLMGSQLDLSLTDSQQIIKDEVTVMNFKPQYVILLGLEVGKLFFPPGVLVVVANRCFTQRGRATEHFHIAICGSQDGGGKIAGPQVEQLQLGFSHS